MMMRQREVNCTIKSKFFLMKYDELEYWTEHLRTNFKATC